MHMTHSPRPPHSVLHTVSNQKLEAGMTWEQGYRNQTFFCSRLCWRCCRAHMNLSHTCVQYQEFINSWQYSCICAWVPCSFGLQWGFYIQKNICAMGVGNYDHWKAKIFTWDIIFWVNTWNSCSNGFVFTKHLCLGSCNYCRSGNFHVYAKIIVVLNFCGFVRSAKFF